jgi:hypothetical protein
MMMIGSDWTLADRWTKQIHLLQVLLCNTRQPDNLPLFIIFNQSR